MAVNENVYGASNQWIDCSFNRYITNKNKVAYFAPNQSRLQNGVTANKLSYETPIDKSLSYCGLGTESALSHIGYIYKVGGTYSVQEWQDNFVTNFAFFQQNSTDIDMSQNVNEYRFDDNNIYTGTTWQVSQTYSNKNKYLQPYTLINPQNQVLCIYIRCCNTTKTDYRDVDLKTYMTTYKTSHPYIICAYINAFFNNQAWTSANPHRTVSGDTETTIHGNLRTLSYGRLDSYKCDGKNFEAYNYYLCDCTVFGFFSRADGFIYQDKLYFIMATEATKEHIHTYLTGGDNDLFMAYVEYFEGVYDEIMKTVACFGLYFTDSVTTASTGKLTDANMCIGLLDENGIGHGQYLRGADTANAPQNEFTDMSQSGYDYTKEVDKTKYDNSTNFNLSLSLGAFTKFYQLSESQVNDLCSALYNVVNAQPSGTSIEEYNMKCFLTNNPIDCIISLKKFPLNHFPSVGVPNDVYLGTVDTGIDAPQLLTTTWVYYFDFSNSSDTGLYPVFGGDFRDNEPYTTIQINVPFCGSFEVPTTYFHKYGAVRVALMIDFITGACTAYLMVNNDVVDSISGSCAVDLPVTGLQSATLNGNIHNTAMMKEQQQTSLFSGLIAGAVSIGVGLATGSIPLAVGGGVAIIGSFMKTEDTGKQINYNVEHMQLPLKQVGSASGAIAQCNDYRCKMIIKRPVMLNYDEEVYAKTIGYACLLNGIVNDFTGLTIGKIEAETIQNGITDEERAMIESLFASGVIL